MTMRVKAVLMLMAALAMMGLAGCDHYVCTSGANFGSSTCTAGTVGLGTTGSGSTTAAFAFVEDGTGLASVVDGYTLDTTTTPPTMVATANYIPPVTPPSDPGMGMAVAQKQFLYMAFGSTNTIYGWIISSSGTLTPVGGSPYIEPFQSSASFEFFTNRVITNPAGTLLFVADEALSQIFVYQIGSGGVLTAVGSPFAVPFPPGNMTTDGLGKYLYVTDSDDATHTGSEIAGYSIGTGSNLGVLTAVPGSPFFGTSPNYQMWQVLGDPTGAYLIGTTGNSKGQNQGFNGSGIDDDNLYVFSINSSSGTIQPAAGSPFATTYSPVSIAVQSNPGGNLVYSFGVADSGTVFNPSEGFTLSSSGTLTKVNGSPFSGAAVGYEGQFDQSGAFLFMYGGLFNESTVIYNVSAFDVVNGAAGQFGLIGTFGGHWVATDPI